MDVRDSRICSTGLYADDDDNFSDDRAPPASPDGYTSGGGDGGVRSVGDKRRRSSSDQEHSRRRAIANSNERKRMQSINAGFSSLRNLVCPKSGDKLSKAAILKYTADFIKTLIAEKQQLLADNKYLEQLLSGTDASSEKRVHGPMSHPSPPLPGKRRWRETESSSSDEGIGFASSAEEAYVPGSTSSSNQSISDLQRQIKELQEQVEKEKTQRLLVETTKTQLEQLQHQQQPTSLPCQPTTVLKPLIPTLEAFNSVQTSSAATFQEHNHGWGRGLETIVAAIRHVEGERGIFGSPEGENPLQAQSQLGSEKICMSLSTPCESSLNPCESSFILRQLNPVPIRDLASAGLLSSTLPTPVCFTAPFHRPPVAIPSS